MDSLQDTPARVEALSGLTRFRASLHACFTRRGDALFELADSMLCAQGPVRSPVELSMEPEFRRGHGSVYGALADGRISADRLRRLLLSVSTQARAGEPLMFAIDTTPHARPDAEYADERVMVQVRGKGGDRWLPGWPYSLMVGVQWGSSSWVDPIEARRLRPGEEHTDVTIEQITGLLVDLRATGKLRPGDPPPLVMLDAGNYATDLTHALAAQDVQLLVRLRSTRVFYRDPAPRKPGQMGAPPRHGAEFSCSDPSKRHTPDFECTVESERYGSVTVRAWTGLHQKLGRTGRWAHYPTDRQLPIVRGTVLQVVVDHLPDGRKPPKDLWLWHAGPVEADPDLLWKAYLRRFDQEHFHRFAKVYLGLAHAHLGSAEATDRWVALVMAAYAQLRLARSLVDDLRRPWHPRPDPSKPLSPYRVRLGFRRLRARLGSPTDSPKLTRPGPGRPRGSKNRLKPKHPPYRKSEQTCSSDHPK
jgi:DDE superfamily endonuclease